VEGIAEVGASLKVRNTPVPEDVCESSVGVIIDYDDGCPAEMKLLHDAEADALEATDNHVIAQ
jgi:hypothetical protein